jgi:hypothetical protein
MGLIAPPASAGRGARIRGVAIIVGIIFALLLLGFGLAKLVALPFGGIGTLGAVFLGLLLVIAALAILALVGRRRQAKALAARAGGS